MRKQYITISLDISYSINREKRYEDNKPERLIKSINIYKLDIESRVSLTSNQLRNKKIVYHNLYIKRRNDLINHFWKILKNHAFEKVRISLFDLLNLIIITFININKHNRAIFVEEFRY